MESVENMPAVNSPVMNKPTVIAVAVPGKIARGYAAWMGLMERTPSKKVEFGTWWRLGARYWRVSWIEATGELYAVEAKPSDRFVVLSSMGKKQVNDLMRKWMDGDNLEALLKRFQITLV